MIFDHIRFLNHEKDPTLLLRYHLLYTVTAIHDSVPVGQDMQENESTAGSEPAGHFTTK